MGYGLRFLTLTTLAIDQFQETWEARKAHRNKEGEGVTHVEKEEKIFFMAKLTKTGGLLLVDDDTASNFSDSELLIAKGSMQVKV